MLNGLVKKKILTSLTTSSSSQIHFFAIYYFFLQFIRNSIASTINIKPNLCMSDSSYRWSYSTYKGLWGMRIKRKSCFLLTVNPNDLVMSRSSCFIPQGSSKSKWFNIFASGNSMLGIANNMP